MDGKPLHSSQRVLSIWSVLVRPHPQLTHVSMSRSGCCTVLPAVCDTAIIEVNTKKLAIPRRAPPSCPVRRSPRLPLAAPLSRWVWRVSGSSSQVTASGLKSRCPAPCDGLKIPNRQVAGSAVCRACEGGWGGCGAFGPFAGLLLIPMYNSDGIFPLYRQCVIDF